MEPLVPHPSTTADQFVAMARSPEAYTRTQVAWDERAPLEALILLADDPDPLVRAAILQNTRVHEHVLARMLTLHPNMRVEIAEHRNAPAALKESLPARQHTTDALYRYTQQRGWGEERVVELIELIAARGEGDRATLGQIVLERGWGSAG